MRDFLASKAGKASAALAVCTAFVLTATAAGADVVSSAFTSEQTSITTYIGDGAVVLVAVMALGIGLRLLVKWIRRAVHAT